MKNLLTLIIFLFLNLSLQSQLVINEIMYNPPESGQDSLEYIEIYNAGTSDVEMEGYSFTEGVVFEFGPFVLGAGEFVVVCVDTAVMRRVFGVEDAFEWTSGGLSNGGEDIAIADAQGNVVDIVDYENGGEWPVEANGNGASLELCDPMRNNNNGQNWKASRSAKGIVINGNELKGSPGIANDVSCADHTIMVRNNFFDPDSITINVGETIEWICEEGIHNVNGSAMTYPGNPESFSSGAAASAPWTYSHRFTTEGDYDYRCDPHFLIGMTGYISVINDQPAPLVITEIMYNDPGADSLEFVEIFNSGDVPVALDGYRVINAISHAFGPITIPEQSYLVLAGNKEAVDQAFGIQSIQWDNGALNNGGEAIEILDAQDRSVDRVDYGNSSPWDVRANGDGYSLILCDVLADNASGENWSISPNATGVLVNGREIFANPGAEDVCEVIGVDYPLYAIETISTIDAFGIPDSNGVKCAVRGIVHGVDLQGNDNIQFTIIDQTGGIGVFSSENFNYEVTEGDELTLKGTIVHFNGLTQMNPDSLRVTSTGNDPFDPRPVGELDESTESEVIVINEFVRLENDSDWDDSGGSFNANLIGEVTGNTYAMRIDNDTEMAGSMRPGGTPGRTFKLSGIGGQFDSSEPHTSGYQILPRYWADFEFPLNVTNAFLDGLEIYPNPFHDFIMVKNGNEHLELAIYGMDGKMIRKILGSSLNASDLPAGTFLIEMKDGNHVRYEKIVKE